MAFTLVSDYSHYFLNSLQSDCSGDGGSHARLGVVSKLKDAYCSRDSAVGGVHSLCLHSVGSERRGEETGDHTNVVCQDA